MKEEFDAVIVANGLFPSHTIPLDILHHAAHLIACDGAISPLRMEGLGEALVIGDGDSVPDEFRDRLICIEEQADNEVLQGHERRGNDVHRPRFLHASLWQSYLQ